MDLKNNAICDICGKPYRVCSSCKEIKSYTPWRTVTDTIQHYAIFLALSQYTKVGNKEKAKEELLKCDLSELDSFKENIKSVIEEIMKEEITEDVSEINTEKNVDVKPLKITKRSKVSVKQDEIINNDNE